MLIFSIILYLLAGCLACLRFHGEITPGKLIIGFFLCTVSINILTVEILSLLQLLNHAGLFLLVQTILCALLAFLLIDPARKIYPSRLAPFHIRIEKTRGVEVFFLVVILLILALDLFVGGLIPINNTDSLHTHLPRIYYWIQHGSLVTWDSPTDTQIYYPINLPIQGAWLFLLGKKETLFFLINWFALAAAAAAIYEITRLLGAGKASALIAALVGLSFPAALLQTFSYQGDLFVAAILLICIYFLILYGIQGKNAALLVSVLPLAIGLGAKQTAVLFLPVYALAVLILLIKKRADRRTVFGLIGLAITALVAFSAYKYVQNFMETDRTKVRSLPSLAIMRRMKQADFSKWLLANTLRYDYQIVSLDGLNGRFFQNLQKIKNAAFRSTSAAMGIDLESHAYLPEAENDYFQYFDIPHINEDSTWYGPLGLIVIPLSLIIVVCGKDKRRKAYAGFSLLLLLVFYAALMATIDGWTNTSGRYFVLPTLALAPLAFTVIPRRRVWENAVSILIAVISFYLAISTFLINENRPIISQGSLYDYQYYVNEKLDQNVQFNVLYRKAANRVIEDLVLTSPARKSVFQNSYYENLFFQNTPDIEDIEFINANILPSAGLYLRIEKTTLEYALFGVNRTRELYPVAGLDQVPPDEYVLVSRSLLPEERSGLSLLAENYRYSIFITE